MIAVAGFSSLSLLADALDDSAAHAGELVGRWIIPALLAAGMAKCVQIMRRPTTHGVCVAALLSFQQQCKS